MSAQPSKAEFVTAIIVEALTVVLISLSLILDEGGRTRHHQRPGVVTAALERVEQNGVFTTNPSYLIGGKELEKVVGEVEGEAGSLSKMTKVGEERRVEESWIVARMQAGERQKSEELRRAYARMWESCPSGSWAPPNVEDVELDALTMSGRLCQGITEADASLSPDASTV